MSGIENLSEHDRFVLRSILDPTMAVGDVTDDGDVYLDDDVDTTLSEVEARNLCIEAVKLAESGDLERALSLAAAAVSVAPHRASSYNDRAQILRLLQREDDALEDLNKALELTEQCRSKTRASALCQRGMLMRKRGNDTAARQDFSAASKLGSKFAKNQVVEMNPYAALCNQMLSQVMRGDKNINGDSKP